MRYNIFHDISFLSFWVWIWPISSSSIYF